MEPESPLEPESPRDYPPPPMPPSKGRPWTVVAFVLAALSLLFLPIILGPIAVFLGVIGLRNGDPLGRWAIIAGIAGTVVGVLLAALVVASDDDEALSLLGLLTR